jgi:tetratricopeptide (TPR) repeat protein
MSPAEIDAIVQRLVANPHDEEALAHAHHAGEMDPKSYALLLEKVGSETKDPVYASHWLSEAANVWSTTLGDAHRAARVLMLAVDQDPTQQVAANRLAQLYRDKGDVKALVAMLDRRARLLTPLLSQNGEIRPVVAGLHEELGKLWSEPPLLQPKKAIENYRRAIELDPESAFAIYSVRELYKSLGQWDDAASMYALELALERDPIRKVALLRDEAVTRKAAGDLVGATRVLVEAREIDRDDPALAQELAGSVLDRLGSGEAVPAADRQLATELLVSLAEVYAGEHGLAYASGALDAGPGDDRAMQLFVYYAKTLQNEEALPARYLAYLQANPYGTMVQEARQALAASYEAAGDPERAARVLDPERRPSGASPPPMTAGLPVYSSAGAGPAHAVPLPGRRPPALSRQAERLPSAVDEAQMLSNQGKRSEALAKYKEVLDADPVHPEALSWVEDYCRDKRDYALLRDVLWAAARAMTGHDSVETRKERLREIAGLSEGNLKDIDGAVSAWKQLLAVDRADESARAALTRLLEKAQRWDDLAHLYEQEVNVQSDIDGKISIERKLATLHETKRKDFVAAAEAWVRICELAPDDDDAIATASKLFASAGDRAMAAQIITDRVSGLRDVGARASLLARLGELREQVGDLAGAAAAFQESAEAEASAKTWEAAERCFAESGKWEEAAKAAVQRAQLNEDAKEQAQMYARASDHLLRAGDAEGALAKLEQATRLDPAAEELSERLCDRYQAGEKWGELGDFLSRVGERLSDKTKRIAARRRAASLFATRLSNKDAAREQWLKVLEDGEDREALEQLIDGAIEREDYTEASTLLRRLGSIAVDKADKVNVALREAELLAEGIGDVDTAVEHYEAILSDLDPACRPALQAIADLQEARDNPAAAADALERELKLVADGVESAQIAERLARLYEHSLDDPRSAIRALDVVRRADPDDFDALARLCDLCEKVEQWDRVAELLAQRIEVEGDDEEASLMTRKLAAVLADKLSRGDEALAVLTEFADQGDEKVRAAYVELGDRLGWKGIVASKLVDWWFEAKNGPERTSALRGAFERFADLERDQDAVRVAIEIVRSKGADHALAEHLEELAVKIHDPDALGAAHDLLARDVSGAERAGELVRQAEVRVLAGIPAEEAIQHGETGLTSVPPEDVEPLLKRLAALARQPAEVVDLYERQVSRSKAPADRVKALGRAAQVAAKHGELDRARSFFDLALVGAPSEETLSSLEEAAGEGDLSVGGETLRRTLAAALAAGGQGARDGGRSRGVLLRRAALMAKRDLDDLDQAFVWLGDALIAHVDAQTLDLLEELAREVDKPARAEETLTRALSEVFDGPLVRQLVARRAKLRREEMGDKTGAAADLKKLHELSPSDQAIMDELSALLVELGDYRGLVQLYEDQILRGKDPGARAELARKVARMWEERLEDPREAADAWRRVLRMKQGDTEATAGLERAKSSMLKRPDASGSNAEPSAKFVSSPVPSSHAPSAPASSPSAPSAPASSPRVTTVQTPLVALVVPMEATRDEGHASPPLANPSMESLEGTSRELGDFGETPHAAPLAPADHSLSYAPSPDRESRQGDSGRRSLPPPLPPPSRRAMTSGPPPLPTGPLPAAPPSADSDQRLEQLSFTDEEDSLDDLPEENFADSVPPSAPSNPAPLEEEDVVVDDGGEQLKEEESSTHSAPNGASTRTVPPPSERN